MALGALIAAYQEDDSGGLRALLPLSGRTLIEYQVRCAGAAGAAPIVVMVERIPAALNDAFERLRAEGVPVLPISDPAEGATRFEPGSSILLIGDGVVPPAELLAQLAEEREPAVATVPDDGLHAGFERIDASSRWAGVALVDGRTLGATASMLGDWDLQSTLLRRALQDGALQLPVAPGVGEPLLAEGPDDLADFEKHLFHASVGARDDWASRYVLPPLEQFATQRLMQTQLPPEWLVGLALLLTLAGAFCFSRGWRRLGSGRLSHGRLRDGYCGRPRPWRSWRWAGGSAAMWRAGVPSSPRSPPWLSPKRPGSRVVMLTCRASSGCFRAETRSSAASRSRFSVIGPSMWLPSQLMRQCPFSTHSTSTTGSSG